MTRRIRLVDAVAVAAAALLGLKAAELLAGPEAPPAEEPPAFGRVIAHARTNYVPPDVSVTGAAPGKPDAKADPKAAPKGQDPTAAPDRNAPKPLAFDPPPNPVSASERALLERLGERRNELLQKSKDMELRERLLEDAERKLESRINELKGVETKQTEAADKRGDTEAGALKNLVIMYEAMKPKDAARVFDRLSLDVLVPVVLQMKPTKMAEVLAVMSPEAAEKLTVALATRGRAKPVEAKAAPAASGSRELPGVE